MLRIEIEIAAAINFTTVIKSFAEKESRKVLMDKKFK